MDTQLDLSIFPVLLSLNLPFIINASDYTDDLSGIYSRLGPFTPTLIDNKLYFKSGSRLYCERRLCIPPSKIIPTLRLVLSKTGHPGSERTVLSSFQNFHSQISKSELISRARDIVTTCEICALTKTNSPSARGLILALPIPSVCNSTIYNDFVSMDQFNDFTYVLIIVCGLSRFTLFIPCPKNIRGEQVFKKILEHWIC